MVIGREDGVSERFIERVPGRLLPRYRRRLPVTHQDAHVMERHAAAED